MRAIILAAGRGSRMKHLTSNKPKCLVTLKGKPLLEWQLKAIKDAGIKEIAIVTGYKKELLAHYKLVEFYNNRWLHTNMVVSLTCAEEWLKKGPCVISYSDIFYEKSAIVSLINCSASLAITYDPNWLSVWNKRFDDPLSDAETFRINTSNQILEIGNRPNCIEEVQGQFMGLLRITPESWKEIVNILSELPPNIRKKIQMTNILQNIVIKKRLAVLGIPYGDKWGEVDTFEDLKVFNNE